MFSREENCVFSAVPDNYILTFYLQFCLDFEKTRLYNHFVSTESTISAYAEKYYERRKAMGQLYYGIIGLVELYLDVLCKVFDSDSWAKPFYVFLDKLRWNVA